MSGKQDYLTKLLEDGWAFLSGQGDDSSRLEYLSDHIFEFDTYDSDMAELFARKAVEVCRAIQTGTTFEYVADPEQHKWYLVMANMEFFKKRIEWGTSIRGAWWDGGGKFNTCGLLHGNAQVTQLDFTAQSWPMFIESIIDFAGEPVKSHWSGDSDIQEITRAHEEGRISRDPEVHALQNECKRLQDEVNRLEIQSQNLNQGT